MPASSGLLASPINGHEWLTNAAELEYACIFPLTTPKDCASVIGVGCDCEGAGSFGYTANNPLCQDSSGVYTQSQWYAKAFPGIRELEVLHDLGSRSVVASICAKSVGGSQSSAYGYSAAMSALVERIESVFPPP